MSTVLGSLSEIAASLFQSLRLSYIVPAFIFWGLNAVFILPSLPSEVQDFLRHVANTFALQKVAFITIVSLLTGYFLYVLNVPVIRWFEGYHWFEWPLLKIVAAEKTSHHQSYKLRLASELENQVELRKQNIAILEAKLRPFSVFEDLERFPILQRIGQLRAELEVFQAVNAKNIQYLYPTSRESFLPTRLGNIVASFEDYSHDHYGMDAVTLWPRLVPILSREKYSLFVEREKANLDFLLNTCLVLLMFSLEMVMHGLFFAQDSWRWLSGAGFTIVISYIIFYRISLIGALSWGQTVRVAFDLYRYELLSALYGRSPQNFGEEKMFWRNISNFFRRPGSEDLRLNPDYRRINEVVTQRSLTVKGETE